MTPHTFLRSSAVLLLLAVLAGPARASLPPVVGEATLVIGVSRLIGADGAPRELQRGAGLRVGDRIETQGGAHVHVRFVDGGLVSIRPGSRLVVEQYAAPAEAGGSSQGAIKFRLEEGVVRSITGAWGEAARERFRLNTPVAAIGVKGTDFVVRSAGESTAASVYTGAIVVAPLTGACAATLGPCSNGAEKLLSADMKGQMLELHRNQATPRLVPAVDLMAMARAGAAEARAAAAEVRPSATPDARPAAEPRPAAAGTAGAAAPAPPPAVAATVSAAVSNVVAAVEARLIGSGAPPSAEAAAAAAVVAARAAVEAAAHTAAAQEAAARAAAEALAQATAAREAAAREAAEAAALALVAKEAAARAAAEAAAREAAARAAAEAAALAAAQAAAEQLARRNAPEQALTWVAFPWAAALAGDDFSRRFDAALLAGTRGVATDGAFTLRRPEATVFAPQDATASFRLTSAAALVARDRGLTLENVQIANGSLDVDFARSTFATSMTATGPVLGSALVQASGGIDAAGAMRSTAGNASVVGGFNGDGYKAGLSFRREVPGGVLQGITLWGR